MQIRNQYQIICIEKNICVGVSLEMLMTDRWTDGQKAKLIGSVFLNKLPKKLKIKIKLML